MIEILLNDRAYEQDIRELLMAFYPGETYVYEPTEGAAFSVEGMVDRQGKEFSLKVISQGSTQWAELPADMGEDLEKHYMKLMGGDWDE